MVVGALGTGQTGLDGGQIQFKHIGEHGVGTVEIPQQVLCLEVGGNVVQLLLLATRLCEVVQRCLVNREVAHGGAILRCHVGDGGAVGNGKPGTAWPEKLNKLANNTLFA
eukprot:Lithocolla_globosa_v1_NODE_1144_length_2839_cov_59.750449.p6 type:complete len:110 gc:universal NODE_1144_length_2839_cov_59.750449:1665-1994(+)